MRDPIERRIALARIVLAWERVWPALWPASAILGIFAAAALLGLFGHIGASLRIPLLLAVCGASGWFLWQNYKNIRAPDWQEAARRLERDGQLSHRPITERHDTLVLGIGDPLAEDLWREHVRAMLRRHRGLKLTLPRSSLARSDPYGIRFAILLLLVVALFAAGNDWSRRLVDAFSLTGSGPMTATLDAWIDPPNYTGLPPIYLPHGERSASHVDAPQGSVIALRVHGVSSKPVVTILPGLGQTASFTGRDQDYAADVKLTKSARVSVTGSGKTLGAWQIRTVPDQPPSVAFTEKPSKTERDSVKLSFTVRDDYGVVSVRAFIHPAKNVAKQRTLSIDLPLSQSSAKVDHETVYRDLTAEPYAGLDVEIALEARDAAGHIAHSAPVRFTLPTRTFTNPLARALVEQRQNLSLDGSAGRSTAMQALDALTLAPEKFFDGKSTGIYTSLRAAFWGLRTPRPDIAHVQDILWQTALGLERGGLSSAAEELRQLQQMLSQAITQGAPQAVIDALLDRYEQALNKYLQMLAQNPPPANQPAPPGSKVLKPQDLQALLRAIQQLAQTGNREQAQQLLAMLQSMLENLHMTAGPGGDSTEDQQTTKTLQGLSDLMGKQRELLDKTFREQQGNPDPKSGGPKGLSQQQGQLRNQLNKLMDGAGKAVPGGKQLGQAGKQMGDAQGALGSRALDSAADSEKKALDAMRQGADALAKQMLDSNGQQQGGAEDADPLGREGNGLSLGKGVRIPDKSQVDRARNILKELRKRAQERERPEQELDYIDRLLKQF